MSMSVTYRNRNVIAPFNPVEVCVIIKEEMARRIFAFASRDNHLNFPARRIYSRPNVDEVPGDSDRVLAFV